MGRRFSPPDAKRFPAAVLPHTHEFVKAIRKLPDLPKVRFHDLRHSHATQLLMEGVHPKIAQERLGHSTITTTLDLYSHVTDTMQDDAAKWTTFVFTAVIELNLNFKQTRGLANLLVKSDKKDAK